MLIRDLYTKFLFSDLLELEEIENFSRCSLKGAKFSEKLNSTVGHLLKKNVFEKGNVSWEVGKGLLMNKGNKTNRSLTDMTPTQAAGRKR